MFRKPFNPSSGADWIAPLSRSLQACRPGVRQRRRVTEASLVVLSLMQDLQLHRGLSCALLDGQQDFKQECAAVAERLQRSLIAAAEQFGDRHMVFRGAAWQQAIARWETLHGGWRDLDVHTNLAVHGGLVMDLVAILRELAMHNRECLGQCRTRVVTEWPSMIEHLGMLRALGLQLLGNRLARDDPRISTALKEHLHEARSALAGTADLLHGSSLLQTSETAIDRVILLRADHPGAGDSQAYYAVMTQLIDAWYRSIREELQTAAER